MNLRNGSGYRSRDHLSEHAHFHRIKRAAFLCGDVLLDGDDIPDAIILPAAAIVCRGAGENENRLLQIAATDKICAKRAKI
ncbi:MAG: hypothetical protein PHS97_03445 [Oscillospiraceae bacterium]|nr:hypothetical protein [Oscillospiraceae bacterium]